MVSEHLRALIFRTIYTGDRAAWLDPDAAEEITDDLIEALATWLPSAESEEKARARSTDPGTSWAAAASVDSLTERQTALLAMLRAVGPTHDEALVRTYQREAAVTDSGLPCQSESGIRTRRAELVRRGLVRDSGEKIALVSGNWSIVWEAL